MAYVNNFRSSAILNFLHQHLTCRFKKGFHLDLYNFCFSLAGNDPMGQITLLYFHMALIFFSILEKINEWKRWIGKKHLKWTWAVHKRHFSKEESSKWKALLENPGIDPGTSRMLSGRSTTWANSPTLHNIWPAVQSLDFKEIWPVAFLESCFSGYI